MNRRAFVLVPLVVIASLACAARAGARQAQEWVALGQREVTDRLDHDLITVTARRGDFRRIKLTVQRAPVDFHRVTIHYGDGSNQEVELRSTIRAGGETRAIDLTGKDRVIRSVEFWYDAKTIRGRRAAIHLFGMR
jgi:hypothetical protein